VKLNKVALLSVIAVVVAGLVGMAQLTARTDVAKPVAAETKAAKAPAAQEKTVAEKPAQKPGCDAEDDDDDKQEVKNGKKVDDDDIEHECENDDDDNGRVEKGEKEDDHHEGAKKPAAVTAAPHTPASPAKASKGR